ncbi:hypothetical protein GOBAR_DD00488 [Gossypium barbadense]|nr:hypothetical protein GOBAR_DD00488 [Gossypium barbadense]
MKISRRHSYIHCDVTCETNVQNVVELAVSRYGKIGIMLNNDGIGSEGKLRVVASNGDNFKKAPSAIASTSLIWEGGDLVAVGGKVALLSIPLGTAYFLVHHIHAFTIHVMGLEEGGHVKYLLEIMSS